MLERYVIHVTKACNMDCIYCYEKDKSSTYTKDEVLKLARQLADGCKADKFGIEFLGGEPMLAFDIIKEVYALLESEFEGRIEDYVITTNGTVLPDEAKSFLEMHPKVIYAVSMDGTKWANQFRIFKNGTGAYEAALMNIQWAVRHLRPWQVNVHMVTHPYNVGIIYNSVKSLYNHGVRAIGIGTVESTMLIDARYCERFVFEMSKVSQSIINGDFQGLVVDLFQAMKPKTDVRTYIKDPKTGKVVGESYGRVANSIECSEQYERQKTTSPLADIIYGLRACVYENHQRELAEATGCA